MGSFGNQFEFREMLLKILDALGVIKVTGLQMLLTEDLLAADVSTSELGTNLIIPGFVCLIPVPGTVCKT